MNVCTSHSVAVFAVSLIPSLRARTKLKKVKIMQVSCLRPTTFIILIKEKVLEPKVLWLGRVWLESRKELQHTSESCLHFQHPVVQDDDPCNSKLKSYIACSKFLSLKTINRLQIENHSLTYLTLALSLLSSSLLAKWLIVIIQQSMQGH